MARSPNYYEAYDDRYRCVYAQGVEYWTNDPDEIATTSAQLDAFLARGPGRLADCAVVEFGCGEGHLAEHLDGKVRSYLGVDLSEAALAKARQRVGASSAARFVRADVTMLNDLPSDAFDVGIDNFCLHMLVTDPDRRAYLTEARRVLRSGGRLYVHAMAQSQRIDGTIDTFEQFLTEHPMDLASPERREAFSRGVSRTIELPRLPARFNTPEGYTIELTHAGFAVDHCASAGHGVILYANKRPSREDGPCSPKSFRR